MAAARANGSSPIKTPRTLASRRNIYGETMARVLGVPVRSEALMPYR